MLDMISDALTNEGAFEAVKLELDPAGPGTAPGDVADTGGQVAEGTPLTPVVGKAIHRRSELLGR